MDTYSYRDWQAAQGLRAALLAVPSIERDVMGKKAVVALLTGLVVAPVGALVGLSAVANADAEATSKVQIVRVDNNVKGTDTSANAYLESVTVKSLVASGAADTSACMAAEGETDMSHWTLSDLTGHTYTFPNGYCLKAGQTVVVRTGRSPVSNPASWWNNHAANLYWNRTSHMYGNSTDSVTLEDGTGHRVDRVAWSDFTIQP